MFGVSGKGDTLRHDVGASEQKSRSWQTEGWQSCPIGLMKSQLFRGLAAAAVAVCCHGVHGDDAETSQDFASIHRANAIRFNTAVFEGWERANPPPRVGDNVGPGTMYRGAPLPPGTVGTILRAVTSDAASQAHPNSPTTACFEVEWVAPSDAEQAADTPAQGIHCYGNGTYELAVLTAVPGMPAVDAVERVPVIEWTDKPADAFAEFSAAADTPLLFQKTAVARWKAATAWQDLETLLENVTLLEGVKVARGTDEFRYYHRAPMNQVDSLVQNYRSTTFTKHDMRATEFLRRLNTPAEREEIDVTAGVPVNGGPAPEHAQSLRYAWAGKVEDWGLLRLSEVLPLDPLMVLGPKFDPSQEHLFRETRVWLSPRDTTTPTHHDISHNMLVQIKGRKRVVMFPPVSWQTLYPWPLLHPGGLSAQTSLAADTDGQPAEFPAFRRGGLLAYVAEVGPGDVLYVPPLWWHSVTALDEVAVSVSVWSPFEGSELYDEAVKSAPLPVKTSWTGPRKAAALRLAIESLVGSLEMNGIDAAGTNSLSHKIPPTTHSHAKFSPTYFEFAPLTQLSDPRAIFV